MYEILFALLLIVTTIFLINNNSRKDRQKKAEQESIKIFLTLDELPKDVKTWVDMFEIIKDYWLINSMSTLSENNLKHWSDASYKNRIESFFKSDKSTDKHYLDLCLINKSKISSDEKS